MYDTFPERWPNNHLGGADRLRRKKRPISERLITVSYMDGNGQQPRTASVNPAFRNLFTVMFIAARAKSQANCFYLGLASAFAKPEFGSLWLERCARLQGFCEYKRTSGLVLNQNSVSATVPPPTESFY
jgi:hypothetical protein